MKIAKLVLPLIAVAALAGCASDDPPIQQVPADSQVRFNGIQADSIKIVTDSQTGCKYIYVEKNTGMNSATAAMSPLYIDSNTVDCRK